jgi:hypothetical protein
MKNENETKMRRKMATADSGTMQLRIKGRDLENSRGRTSANRLRVQIENFECRKSRLRVSLFFRS